MKKRTNALLFARVMAVVLALGLMLIPAKTVSAVTFKEMNTPTNISPNQKIDSVFDEACQRYTYLLTLPSSGRLNVSLSGHANGDFCIYDTVAEDEIQHWVHKTDETNTFNIDLLAGTYKVTVASHWYSWEVSAGTYTTLLAFVPSGETRSENYMSKNNDAGNATAYTLGTKIVGHLAQNDGLDMYTFKIAKAGYLKISATAKVSRMKLECTNQEGNISYNETMDLGNHSYSFFAPPGTYYVTFKHDDGYGNYEFKINRSDLPKVSVKRIIPKSKQLWRGRDRYLIVKWKPNSSVSGYHIQIARDKKFKKGKKSVYVENSSWSSNSQCEIKNLKKTKYYVRIRTFTYDNQKIKHYSAWSAVKTGKITK